MIKSPYEFVKLCLRNNIPVKVQEFCSIMRFYSMFKPVIAYFDGYKVSDYRNFNDCLIIYIRSYGTHYEIHLKDEKEE